jgi:hypothetical protein
MIDDLIKTALPDIRAFTTISEQFDPLLATDRELMSVGLPVRPPGGESSRVFENWRRRVMRRSERIVPELVVTDRYHGPAKNIRKHPSPNAVLTATSTNWSGSVAVDATNPWRGDVACIDGEWVVPAASCSGVPGGQYYSSQWVGLDGWNSPDVFQCGVESDIGCPGSPTCYFWIEWYPNPSIRIGNLPISPGEVASVVCIVNPGGMHLFTLENMNASKSVTVQIQPPPNTRIIGNCAEWIVERPSINGQISTLANYNQVLFSGAAWFNYGQGTPSFPYAFPGAATSTGDLILVSMTENGSIASSPTIVGSGQNSKLLCVASPPW